MAQLPIVRSNPVGARDGFGRRVDYLRLSLTDRCNLRCTYCMPAEGVALQPREQLLRFDEIYRIAAAARSLGFRKFRITGGEPLVVRDIVSFARGLREAVGQAVIAMTTNAVRLQPLALPLRKAGVMRINISCDTLRAEKFTRLTRRSQLSDVLAGIDAALGAGFERVKINVVVVPGVNDDEIPQLARFAQHHPVQVRYIEAMPLVDEQRACMDADAVLARLQQAYELQPIPPEDPAQPARLVYRVPGWQGSLALIAPLTRKFCDTCNRLRLTPYGELKGCLLTPGGMNLRAALRHGITDAQLRECLRSAIAHKPLAYDDADHGLDATMNAIGG